MLNRIALATLALLLAGCGDDASSSATGFRAETTDTIEVTSTAFAEGEPIPEHYTCDGEEVSPPLAWSGIPPTLPPWRSWSTTRMRRPGPSPTGSSWTSRCRPPRPRRTACLRGGIQATSSAGDAAYAGPCPPSGTHHYRFTVVAAGAATGLPEGSSLDDALAALDGHVVAGAC